MALDDVILNSLFGEAQKTGAKFEASYAHIIGMVIAMLRRQQDISQNELSKLSGVSQSTISRIEMGDADLTASQIDSIACTLGKTPGFIFDAADEIRDFLKTQRVEVPSRSDRSQTSALGKAALNGAHLVMGVDPIALAIGSAASMVLANMKNKRTP